MKRGDFLWMGEAAFKSGHTCGQIGSPDFERDGDISAIVCRWE